MSIRLRSGRSDRQAPDAVGGGKPYAPAGPHPPTNAMRPPAPFAANKATKLYPTEQSRVPQIFGVQGASSRQILDTCLGRANPAPWLNALPTSRHSLTASALTRRRRFGRVFTPGYWGRF